MRPVVAGAGLRMHAFRSLSLIMPPPLLPLLPPQVVAEAIACTATISKGLRRDYKGPAMSLCPREYVRMLLVNTFDRSRLREEGMMCTTQSASRLLQVSRSSLAAPLLCACGNYEFQAACWLPTDVACTCSLAGPFGSTLWVGHAPPARLAPSLPTISRLALPAFSLPDAFLPQCCWANSRRSLQWPRQQLMPWT